MVMKVMMMVINLSTISRHYVWHRSKHWRDAAEQVLHRSMKAAMKMMIMMMMITTTPITAMMTIMMVNLWILKGIKMMMMMMVMMMAVVEVEVVVVVVVVMMIMMMMTVNLLIQKVMMMLMVMTMVMMIMTVNTHPLVLVCSVWSLSRFRDVRLKMASFLPLGFRPSAPTGIQVPVCC